MSKSEMVGRVLRSQAAIPMSLKVTVQPPGLPPRDFLIRPMPDCYLLPQPNGQTSWTFVGMDMVSCQMVQVPFDHIKDRQLVLLDPADLDRLETVLRLDEAFLPAAGDGKPHAYSDDDVTDPTPPPPSAVGRVPVPVVQGSETNGEVPTPPA